MHCLSHCWPYSQHRCITSSAWRAIFMASLQLHLEVSGWGSGLTWLEASNRGNSMVELYESVSAISGSVDIVDCLVAWPLRMSVHSGLPVYCTYLNIAHLLEVQLKRLPAFELSMFQVVLDDLSLSPPSFPPFLTSHLWCVHQFHADQYVGAGLGIGGYTAGAQQTEGESSRNLQRLWPKRRLSCDKITTMEFPNKWHFGSNLVERLFLSRRLKMH